MLSGTSNWLDCNLSRIRQMMNIMKREAAICFIFISSCSWAGALDAGRSLYDLADTKTLPAVSQGKIFKLIIDRYWRENFNAHSYSVIIISFAGERGREVVPVEDENKTLQDFVIDAPADFECFRK